MSSERPDSETGVFLIEGAEPTPHESRGGWFGAAKGFFASAKGFASDAKGFASEYATELYDKTSDFITNSPTVAYVDETLSTTINKVSDSLESVGNALFDNQLEPNEVAEISEVQEDSTEEPTEIPSSEALDENPPSEALDESPPLEALDEEQLDSTNEEQKD